MQTPVFRIYFLSLASLILLTISCNEIKEVPADKPVAYYPEEEMFSNEEFQMLPSGKEQERVWDSLITAFEPLLLIDPAERPARDLQGMRGIWEPVFGSYDRLAYNISITADDYLAAGDVASATRLFLALGHFCNVEGDHLLGTSFNDRAYEIARENRDTSSMGWALSQSSDSFIFTADSASAMGYLRRALVFADATKNYGLKASIYVHIGAAHHYVGHIEGLYDFNQLALALSREHGLSKYEQLSLTNIAYALNFMGQPKKAIELLHRDFIPSKNHLTDATAFMQLVLFESFLSLGRFEEAEKALDIACQISEKSGFFFSISYCKKGLVDFYEKRGDLEEAIKRLRDYYAHRELALNDDAQKDMRAIQIAQLEKEKEWTISRLEQERKEQEFQQRSKLNKRLFIAFGICFLIILWLFYKMGRTRIREASQQTQLAEVKLKLLREKMNPHFMFNAINGIQNQILKSNSIEAYNYLGKFADLLRVITKSEASFFTGLQEEIEFLTTYLELEQLRFRQQFECEIIIDEELKTCDVLIPSMMIQPFVENAIVHGLSILPRKGRLTITLEKLPGNIRCIVEDNGRGRVAANLIKNEHKSEHLSVASDIADRRIDFLRDSGYEDTRIDIEDLYHHGEACGTRVTLILPIIKADTKIEQSSPSLFR
ncbi:histidine kinase [Neolewinella agarilytica]|uniref:tetratricopeptide repeat-containing sensor histidine kinase n=1 Tax=Neolewinella agarilytica TaxID=478744 RepID=UPI002355C40E|nr:histidine kinase [Neolewinella agarilytica]